MEENLEVIRESLVSFTSLKKDEIHLNSDLSGDLCLESIDRLELVLNLEEIYKVTVPPEEYSFCSTIQDVIQLIKTEQQTMEEII